LDRWNKFFPSEKVTPPLFCVIGPWVFDCWARWQLLNVQLTGQISSSFIYLFFFNLPPSEMRTGLFPRLFDVGWFKTFAFHVLAKGGIIGGAKFLVNIIPPVHK
jgi:hypothetical protein